MSEKISETNLLAECKNGNREAFEDLYNRHQRRVFSVALNYFGGDIDKAAILRNRFF